MVISMLCDYHVHTAYSDDSTYPMEQVIQDAIKLQMKEICITDHVDYGVKKDLDDPSYHGGITNVDYPKYMQEIQHLQKKYGNEICIKIGMEFGMQMHTIPQFEKLYQRYPFDFIILSCHQVGDKEFWTQDYQKGKTQKEYQRQYYEEILHVIQVYKHYSVLGHLDLIQRYDNHGPYPFAQVKDIICEILKMVIQDGKGIEINTSSHRYGLNDLTPSKEILQLYRELGGTILTIGSDSHEPAHLGAYIEETKEIAKALGFTHYATFTQMKPSFHLL